MDSALIKPLFLPAGCYPCPKCNLILPSFFHDLYMHVYVYTFVHTDAHILRFAF